MNKLKTLASLAAVAALFAGSSSSALAGVIVSSASPDWLLLPNSIGQGGAGTYGLPANLSGIGCGTENETTCEPTGVFLVSDSFIAAPGYYTIQDPDGTLSDVITFDNGGPGGNGMIQFFSDPNPSAGQLPTSGVNLGSLCTETTAGGCSGTFTLVTTNGTSLVVSPASDDETAFDPFGYGFDTSDQIKFAGQDVTVQTPEPATLALLSIGLAGMLFGKRRKLS